MLVPHRLVHKQNVVAAFVAATLYGLVADVLFQVRPGDWWRTLSIGFLLMTPFAVGAITLALSPPERRSSWIFAIFAPWVPCAVIGIVAVLLAVELMVCVVIALPIFNLMSSLGGLAVTWRYRRALSKHGSGSGQAYSIVALLMIAPAVISPLEQRFPEIQQEYRVVESVMVPATPETVWHEIVAVDMIQPHEQRLSWFQAVGLPQPHEATLHQDGLKRVRTASYSNGIRVREPIEVWEPYMRFGFTVELAQIPAHQSLWGMVDGKYLDVTYVEFTIEDRGEGADQGMTHLQFLTVYRLSTPVNGYARAWIDFLLSDFQRYILKIVSSRASLVASAI